MGPLSAHRVFWNNPTAKGMIEFVSVLVVGDRIGEGSAKLSPDFPAGIVWFLLIDTLPCTLSLDGFKVAIVHTRVKLITLSIGDVSKGGNIKIQPTPIYPPDLDWFPFGIC